MLGLPLDEGAGGVDVRWLEVEAWQGRLTTEPTGRVVAAIGDLAHVAIHARVGQLDGPMGAPSLIAADGSHLGGLIRGLLIGGCKWAGCADEPGCGRTIGARVSFRAGGATKLAPVLEELRTGYLTVMIL